MIERLDNFGRGFERKEGLKEGLEVFFSKEEGEVDKNKMIFFGFKSVMRNIFSWVKSIEEDNAASEF